MAGLDSGFLSGASDIALNIFVIVFALLFVVAFIIGVIMWYASTKKWDQYDIVIWVKDGFGNIFQKYDKAGIFVDGKTNTKRLFLKNSKVGLSTEQIPFIPNDKGGRKTIYLRQDGLKNFRFIHIAINSPVSIQVSEEDVNWAINSYEAHKKLFQNTLLMQLLPYMAIAFVSLIILIIFIYFFKDFGVLRDTAVAFQAAAEALTRNAQPVVVTQ